MNSTAAKQQGEFPFPRESSEVDRERDRELDQLQKQREHGEALARENYLQRGFRVAGHLDDY